MKAGWKWMITILNFQEERTAVKSQWEKGSGRREPKTHPEGEQKPTQRFSGLKMTEAVFSHRAAGQSSTHTWLLRDVSAAALWPRLWVQYPQITPVTTSIK